MIKKLKTYMHNDFDEVLLPELRPGTVDKIVVKLDNSETFDPFFSQRSPGGGNLGACQVGCCHKEEGSLRCGNKHIP